MTYRFPNGWVGGAALVLGLALLLSATLSRSPFNFFFPDQLRAVAEHPVAQGYGDLHLFSFLSFRTGPSGHN